MVQWGWPPGMVHLPPAPDLPRAACRGLDPGLFVTQRGQDVEPAKAICKACPELGPCRDYALSAPLELGGIWGATSAGERRALRATGRTVDEVDALDDVTEPDEAELETVETRAGRANSER